MTESRCPHCAEAIQPGFRVCPYCAAPLAAAPAELPEVLPAPAERQGRRDLGRIGAGLVVVGLLGFIGVILSLGHGGRFDPDTILMVGGGTILMVVAGSIMASVGRRDRGAAGAVVTGVLGGVAGALMGVVLGVVLVFAVIIYAINDCLSTCGGKQSTSQQRR